jgi:hypothetical protein
MVFLSDGQSSVQEKAVVDLCRSAIQRGWVALLYARFADGLVRKPLSFHAVSFGPDGDSTSSSSNMWVAFC